MAFNWNQGKHNMINNPHPPTLNIKLNEIIQIIQHLPTNQAIKILGGSIHPNGDTNKYVKILQEIHTT